MGEIEEDSHAFRWRKTDVMQSLFILSSCAVLHLALWGIYSGQLLWALFESLIFSVRTHKDTQRAPWDWELRTWFISRLDPRQSGQTLWPSFKNILHTLPHLLTVIRTGKSQNHSVHFNAVAHLKLLQGLSYIPIQSRSDTLQSTSDGANVTVTLTKRTSCFKIRQLLSISV